MTSEVRSNNNIFGFKNSVGTNALFVALECKPAKLNMKYTYNFKIFSKYICYQSFTAENCLGINPEVCISIMSTIERIKFFHLNMTLYTFSCFNNKIFKHISVKNCSGNKSCMRT